MIDLPDDRDDPDALRDAFDSYRRAPRDVVRLNIEHSTAELSAMAASDVPQEITHYEMTDSGITKHVERVMICAPLTERNEN